jgi:hypothetical protein
VDAVPLCPPRRNEEPGQPVGGPRGHRVWINTPAADTQT